tara:strand:+ start:3411 stop:3968 length:558 start_codon:yes stop_codon:yes gene_type:complete
MPNYENGKIYKIWSPQGEENEVYYGSTTLDLSKRKTHHKTLSRKCTSSGKCTSSIIFEKYEDVRIELVEKCSCNDKEELNKKEGHYIRNYPCLNKVIPDRTHKEYKKAYYENNKEAIAEKRNEHYANNKEAIAEQEKEYRAKNKEKIQENRSKKVTCECGCIIRKDGLAKHQKTEKHLLLMKHLE